MKKIKLLVSLFSFLLIFSASFIRAHTPQYFAEPDTAYISNAVIDILRHNGAIWFATDDGLNFSYDGGQTWLYYDETNGLVSSSVSAMFSIPVSADTTAPNRIWVATNHNENISGTIFGISDGVSYSDDNGFTWNQINFEAPPNDIENVWGGDRQIYDITGHYDSNNLSFDNWMFFTAFGGGFLASKDGGMSWRRIFPSVVDSLQFYNSTTPSLRNRYFSCVVDTSHGDSMFVWAGTAAGFFEYVFIEQDEKPVTKEVTDITLCNNCGTGDSNFVYIGGKNGLTRFNKTTRSFDSKFDSTSGLPDNYITALLDKDGILFAGTASTFIDSQSTGLAISDDYGESFNTVTFGGGFLGLGRLITDFAVINDRIYMAVQEAGLFVSDDDGTSWQHIFVDSTETTTNNRRNVIQALHAVADTLYVGTDSGMVNLYLSPTGTIDSLRNYVFDESSVATPASTKIIDIEVQRFNDSVDIIWTVNIPSDNAPVAATKVIGRSDDRGVTYEVRDFNANNYDIAAIGDTLLVAGDYGVYYTDVGFFQFDEVPDLFDVLEVSGSTVTDDYSTDIVHTIDVFGDTVAMGSENGFALSYNRGLTFNITRINLDTLSPDIVINYTNDISGIDGNFIPALDVQYGTSDSVGRVWASVRPAFGGLPGISASYLDSAITYYYLIDTTVTPPDTTIIDSVKSQIRLWSPVHDDFAWNFAFAGDTVYAATNDGLLWGISDSLIFSLNYTWNVLDFKDSLGYDLLLPGTPVYAVDVDDNYIWVGTDDRTIRVDRGTSEATALYVIDSETPADEVYAFPVPFSHVQNNQLEFHFVVEEQANITLEIYDFAMNLVDRVIDNEPFDPGIYPTAGYGRRTWDGLNGKGDEVAVGVYYFKMEYSTGEVRWGKLAVIP